MAKMAYFVYILQSDRDGRLYIGSTDDVERRLTEHNKGQTRSLKSRRPLKLIYKEEVSDRRTGRKRERLLKSYKGGNAFKKLIHNAGVV